MSGKKRILTKYIDTASSNVPTSFATAATSKVVTGLGGAGYTKMKIINTSAGRLAFCLTDADSAGTAPSSSTTDNTSQFFVREDSTEIIDDLHIYDTLFVRSDTGGAISSGLVIITFM